MNQGKQRTTAGPIREASLREKRAHLDSIEAHIFELAERLTQGDQKPLQKVLDFFGTGRKCSRWSYWNLVGLLAQRPDLQRPVTIREAAEVGHYKKSNVKPAAIFVPRVVELPSEENPSQENSSGKEALPWKANWAQRLQLFPDGLLLQVWQVQSAPWAWLKATYPGLQPLELGTANSLVDAQDKALASLSEEQRRDLVKVYAAQNSPKPRTRTYFNLVHCVVELGRDTVGPKLMADLDETGEDLGQVLEGIVEYAHSVGVDPIAHRRSVEDLASGSIGTAWGDGKVFISDALSPERKIGAWLHELTHWITHLRPEAALLNISGGSDAGDRHIRELQAEACAYVVCKSLGIPSSFSIGYLAGWKVTKRDVELNLRVIAQVSRELLQGITPLIKKNSLRIENTLTAIPEPEAERAEVVPESWQEFEKALQSQRDQDEEKSLSPVIARNRGV
jgi:hypothetical protein